MEHFWKGVSKFVGAAIFIGVVIPAIRIGLDWREEWSERIVTGSGTLIMGLAIAAALLAVFVVIGRLFYTWGLRTEDHGRRFEDVYDSQQVRKPQQPRQLPAPQDGYAAPGWPTYGMNAPAWNGQDQAGSYSTSDRWQ